MAWFKLNTRARDRLLGGLSTSTKHCLLAEWRVLVGLSTSTKHCLLAGWWVLVGLSASTKHCLLAGRRVSTQSALVLALSIVLTSCASVAPETNLSYADRQQWYQQQHTRQRLLELAEREWQYFGGQIVDTTQLPERIYVGHWEDEDGYAERVGHYWRAVGIEDLDGNACQQPWSAAFMSWLFSQAGVQPHDFLPDTAHYSYIRQMVEQQQRLGAEQVFFIPHTLDYRPQPGDLICANRGRSQLTQPSDVLTSGRTPLHCDLVLANQPERGRLSAVGGNVRNSVALSYFKVDASGRLLDSRWFLVIENRLP